MPDQLPLFGFRDTRPRAKVPISEARIREVQEAMEKGDSRTAVEKLRDIRYGLENYCKRINQAKKN
jgi:hypothetical protein